MAGFIEVVKPTDVGMSRIFQIPWSGRWYAVYEGTWGDTWGVEYCDLINDTRIVGNWRGTRITADDQRTVSTDLVSKGVVYRARGVDPTDSGLHMTLQSIVQSDDADSILPLEPPTPPEDLKAEGGDRRIVLTWDHNRYAGRVPMLDYQRRIKRSSATNWGNWTDIDIDLKTVTITGLTADAEYDIQMRSRNNVYDSEVVEVSASTDA